MPAESKSQQRLMGMVTATKEHKLKNPPEKIKEVAKHISLSSAKDFAKTKHKGLPEHVKKAYVDGLIERAMEYGLDKSVCTQLAKRAGELLSGE